MTLKATLAETQTQRLKKEIAALERQNRALAEAVSDARSVKRRVVLKAAPPKRQGREFVRVIIPDSHGSAIDRRAAAAFLADLKRLDPAEIVMLGDHVDCGGFLAQHHTLGYVAQTDYSYAEDLEAANNFLDAVQAAAPKAAIHYIEGNHERRIETWAVTQTLRHSKDAETLRRAFPPEVRLRLK